MELSEALLTFLVGGIAMVSCLWLLNRLPSRASDKFGVEELGLLVAAFAIGFVAENLTGALFRCLHLNSFAPRVAIRSMERQFLLAWPAMRDLFPDQRDAARNLTGTKLHHHDRQYWWSPSPLAYPSSSWSQLEASLAHDLFARDIVAANALYYEAVNWGRGKSQQHAEVSWLHRRAQFARTCGITLILVGCYGLSLCYRRRTNVSRSRMAGRCAMLIGVGIVFSLVWWFEDVRFNKAVVGAFLSEVAQRQHLPPSR